MHLVYVTYKQGLRYRVGVVSALYFHHDTLVVIDKGQKVYFLDVGKVEVRPF